MKSIMIVCMVGLLFVATSVNAAIITSYARDGSEVGSERNGAFLDDDDVAELTGAAPTIGGVATNVTAVTINSNQEVTITYTVTGSGFDFSYDVIVTAWQSVSGVESMVNIRENGGEVMPDSSLPGEHRQRIDSPDTVGAGNWEFVRLTIDNLVIKSGGFVSLLGFNTVRIDSVIAGADGNVENAGTDAVIASWIGGVIDPTTGKYRVDVDLTSAYASSIDLVATSNSGIENSENQPRGFAADFAVGPVPTSPANGATVPIGDVDLSWTNMDPNNMDPNNPGGPVFVDVWFGTEPNELNPNYDMALVITDPADGRNVAGVAVKAPVDGTYYWQVANYIYGDREGDPIEGPLASFIAVSDRVPTVQIDTPNTMTWSDEPVLLDWDWTDDGSPALSWGAEPDGIDDPNLNVEFFDGGPNQTEVAITNNTGSMVTVTVTLTVDDGNNDPVAASIELDVYPTACDMTRLGQGISDISDVNDDCVINLDDFAIFIASKWLDDYSATEPAARQ